MKKRGRKKILNGRSISAVLFIAIVLAAVPLTSFPAQAAAAPLDLGQAVAPGIWVQTKFAPDKNDTSESALNKVYLSLPQFFLMDFKVYKVVTQGNVSYESSGKIYAYWVRLISDPDNSLNQTTPSRSGDEVRVWTWFIFQNGSYTNTLNSLNHYWYQFDTGSGNWTRLNQSQIEQVNNTAKVHWLANLGNKNLKPYYASMIRQATNVTSPKQWNSTYAYFTYWVDQAFLPKIERNPTGYDFEAFVAKHRLLAFVAYNDTNDNNVFDITVKRGPLNSRVVSSTESTYVFKSISAGEIDYSDISRTTSSAGDEISWGFSITDLLGNMTSVDEEDQAIPAEISSVGFDFHFNRTSTEALLKVDSEIGQFNIPETTTVVPSFNDLSLAVAYYSFFGGVQISKYPTNETSSGTIVDNEGNSTTTSELNFKSGGTDLVSIGIGGDPYIWNGTTTETAHGVTIPWYSYQSSFSELGNKSVVDVSFSKEKSFYIQCFPKWSGYSIDNDPYFAVMSYGAQPSGTGVLPILVIGGAGIGIALAAVTVFVLRRRRMQVISIVPQNAGAF